jgi:polysaccharide biosynthesis protein PelF
VTGGLRVALVNEGTYPFVHGGVSVWCDHLVRGLAEHEFVLGTLVGSGQEKVVWDLPTNVVAVHAVPLWSPAPAGRRTRHRAVTRAAMADLAAGIGADTEEGQIERALRALLTVADSTGREEFHAEVRDGQLASALFATGYRADGRWLPVTGAEAVAAAELIERTLLVLAVNLGPVNLVHAVVNGPAALVGLAAQWRWGTPYLLSEHGVYLRERYLALRDGGYQPGVKRLFLRFLRWVVGACYASAELVLPVSGFNRRWAVRHGAAPERVITVFNGVDEDRYPSLDAEPAEPTIAWVGRIDPLKDLETLIRAFGLVRSALPHAMLRLFGPCPAGNESYRARCVALVTELGLADGVRFEGPVNGSRPALAAGQLVALSSISEGMPYTVIEAMMCGRATVSTDVGGIREAVGDTGLVVPPRNPQAFAAACLELLHDPDRRQRLGRAAGERARSLFTLDESTDCYRLLYRTAHRRIPAEVSPEAPATPAAMRARRPAQRRLLATPVGANP